MLTTDAQLVVAADTGRGSLITTAGDVWTLNATAVTVVQVIEQGGGAADAAAALLARFPGQRAAAVRRDVDTALRVLLRHQVVVDR